MIDKTGRSLLIGLAALLVTVVMAGIASSIWLPETYIEPTKIGRPSGHNGTLDRIYDHDAGVVCWIYSGSVSCLPIDQTDLDGQP